MEPGPELAGTAFVAPHVGVMVAGAALATLFGVLGGVWLGFKICVRDAALLARFATDAIEAKALGDTLQSDFRTLRQEVVDYVERAERKRAQMRAAQQRLEESEAKGQPAGAEDAQEPPADDLKARRRAIARRAAGAA